MVVGLRMGLKGLLMLIITGDGFALLLGGKLVCWGDV